MSEETSAATEELEALLNRLQDAHQTLMDAIADTAPDQFDKANNEGDSAKRILERSADDVNFYYGRLVAQALSLPQPPGLETADFQSLAEARASLQEAHKRLSNLLHNITTEDLSHKTRLESTTEYTLQQVLETSAAHYRFRAGQLKEIASGVSDKEG